MKQDLSKLTPKELRALFHTNELVTPTAGLCPNYVQANLVMVEGKYGDDLVEFLKRNPKPCPIVEVIRGERPISRVVAPGSDISMDLPLYRVWRNGTLCEEVPDVSKLWKPDMVAALIGCSLSFETKLLEAGIRLAHYENHTVAPCYDTNIPCEPAGPFRGNYVVSMRPMPKELVARAVEITEAMPRVHGGPVHIGDPAAIGIKDLMKVDYGDPPVMRPDDVPVFWACGITPQAVVMTIKPEFAITHAPGYMFVSDVPVDTLVERRHASGT